MSICHGTYPHTVVDGTTGEIPRPQLYELSITYLRVECISARWPWFEIFAMKLRGPCAGKAGEFFPESPRTRDQRILVALIGAGVGEGLACYGNELPLIGARAEVEFEDARSAEFDDLQPWGLSVVDLTSARIAPCACHELADAVLRVSRTPRSYRSVALVAVGVAGEYDIGVMVVEDLPERLHPRRRGTASGGEEGVVEVGEGAPRRMVGQVVPQPASLGGIPSTPTDLGAVAVEGEDVPASAVVTVVASV